MQQDVRQTGGISQNSLGQRSVRVRKIGPVSPAYAMARRNDRDLPESSNPVGTKEQETEALRSVLIREICIAFQDDLFTKQRAKPSLGISTKLSCKPPAPPRSCRET